MVLTSGNQIKPAIAACGKPRLCLLDTGCHKMGSRMPVKGRKDNEIDDRGTP